MTKEEIEVLKAQRKERRGQMLLCICCDELDLKDLGDKGYGKGKGKGKEGKGGDKGGKGKGEGKGGD